MVLHDLQDKDTSIVAIENGHLSGRKVGDPSTDFILETVHTGSYQGKDFESGYIARTHQRTFLSSSYFIKDHNTVVGALCINIDSAPFKDAIEVLEQFVPHHRAEPEGERVQVQERLFGNTREIIGSMVEQACEKAGVPRERMSQLEKMEIVRELNQKGAFQLRGAASEIGVALRVSEPTVYRYLNKVR